MKEFVVNLFTTEPFLFLKGALIFMIGPLDVQLAYLFIAIGIDLLFGIQVARKEQSFRWFILLDKVRKKIFVYIMWISLFHAFGTILGLPDSARWSVILLLAGMEVVSAIKNTARLGHSRLSDALEGLYFSLVKNNPAIREASAPVAATPSQEDASKAPISIEGSVTNGEPRQEDKPK